MPPQKTYVNVEKLNLSVQRTHSVHVTQRIIEWEVKCALGELADYYPTGPTFARGDTKAEWKMRTTEDKLKGTFENELTLPPFGGVQYEVTATRVDSKKEKKKLTAQYVAWRKIYFAVNYMNAACKAMLESILPDVKRKLADVFIELEQTESNQLTVDEPRTKRIDKNPTFEPPEVDDGVPRVQQIWKNQHPHHELLVFVVNDIYGEATTAYPPTLKEPSFTRASTSLDVSFIEGERALRLRSTIPAGWAMRDFKLTGLEFAEGGTGTVFLNLDEAALRNRYTMENETPQIPYFDIPLDNDTFRAVLAKVDAREKINFEWTPGDDVTGWEMVDEAVSKKSRILYDEDRKVLRLPVPRTARERKMTALKVTPSAGGASLVDLKTEAELTGKFTVTTRPGLPGTYFKVPLDNATFRPVLEKLGADRPVTINMRNTANSSLGGYHTKGKSVIVVTCIQKPGELAENTVKRTRYAFLHEFGHAIGMVRGDELQLTTEEVTKEKFKTGNYRVIGDKWFRKNVNPLAHEGQGGKGTHCKTGSKAALEEGIRVPKDAGELCIMHHGIYERRMEHFCDNCKKQIIRNEVVV